MAWRDGPASPLRGFESYSGPGSGFSRFTLAALGTENVFLLAGDEEDLREAAGEAFTVVEGLEQRLSKFLPESDVSLVNRLGASRPVSVGGDCLQLLARSREAWELTEGVFDPTVGPLLEAWGLVDRQGRRPSEVELERLLELRGMDLVEIDSEGSSVRLARPGVSLDLGGIGKGYIVDRVVERLRGRGVPCGAVLSGRSTLRVWGTPPGAERWRVEVADPNEPDEGLAVLSVEPGAVSSSGGYERFVRCGDETYGHIIDPRSGRPVRAHLGSTVWSGEALLGDVLSTTLFVSGEEAVRPGGPVERLVRAWTPVGEEPRASLLWIDPEPSRWGGLEMRVHHIGRPGFQAAATR